MEIRGIDEVTDLSLKILGKLINSIPLFYERNFNEMPFMIYFRIDKLTESMLSITSSQECSIVQLVTPIIEFISLSI